MIRMKRTKQADFADILSALGDMAAEKPPQVAADDEDEEQISPAGPQDRESHPANRLHRFLGSLSWRWRIRFGGNSSDPAAAYAQEAAEAAEFAETISAGRGAKPEAPKTEPVLTEDEAIAEELGLRADLADVDLKQIRREFAKKNHPDRFGPAQRVRAARRMSIANMLIDQHLKQRAQPQ